MMSLSNKLVSHRKTNIQMKIRVLAYALILLTIASFHVACSNEQEFQKPTIVTLTIVKITAGSAASGGFISSDNGSPIIARGICWSTKPNPILEDNVIMDRGTGAGSFEINLTNLNANTTYYVCAFATNKGGTSYGNEFSFTTQNGQIDISTTAASSITKTSANIAGAISGDGGSNITERGIYWSTSANPTISGQKFVIGNGTGNFSKVMTNLTSNTTYYYCAYATNYFGTVYGNEQFFTTLAENPKACFEITSNVGLKVTFSNCSEYPTSCLWDFGDGTTSTDKEPIHVFSNSGTYNVKLTASNEGFSDIVTKTIIITDEISLNNFIVSAPGTQIDIDLDGVADFMFEIWSSIGTSSSYSYKRIKALNNYEVITDTASTRVTNIINEPKFSTYLSTIPKIYVLGDTIQSPYTTNNGTIYFYSQGSDFWVGRSYVCDIWKSDVTRYVAFRKIDGGITKIGWIKLKVFNSIVLESFKIPMITGRLTIR
jgi:PKD repeat protein